MKKKGYTIDDRLVNDLNQYGKGKKAPKAPPLPPDPKPNGKAKDKKKNMGQRPPGSPKPPMQDYSTA